MPNSDFALDLTFEEALERFANVNVNVRDVQDTPDLTMEIEDGDATDAGKATPFVKWVGGKRSIIDELLTRLPPSFNHYYEPFVGGGALFFALNGRLKEAFLSDANFELVIAYNAIRKDVDKLLVLLEKHAKKHSEEYFYKVRDQHNLQDPIQIAARFIYLNKTCFNGLYRVNKSGEFNVPVGRYANPGIVSHANLLACNRVLQKARIELHDFDLIFPSKRDFVYFDPPYHPTNDTSFTRYTTSDFSEKDQLRLRDFALKLHQKGVFVMLSNSDAPYIRSIYGASPFKIAEVQAPRNVNCKSTKRGNVGEVVITNY